jgi:hypothetical protein
MVEKSEQLREVLVTVQDKLVVNGQRIIRWHRVVRGWY